MKAIYNIFSAALLLLLLTFTSCEGEKDLIVIEGNLPIKTETLYMVGDATPAGWNIGEPTPFAASAEDALVFAYEGRLNAGEFKCCLVKGSWDAPFIHPMTQAREINKGGIDNEPFQLYAGGDDLKWKVTDAGNYRLVFDLRNWTMAAVYQGE